MQILKRSPRSARELPGCTSAGDTEEEAKQNIKEAIELYLAPSDLELSRNAKVDEVTVG
jgi:predicted RNase H-like HicB family nuclease